MARISKSEHNRILQLVDVDRQKVPDVAARYGCTPANIYALLGKLRRSAAAMEAVGSDSAGTTKCSQATIADLSATDDNPAPGVDLFLVPEPASLQAALHRSEAADLPAEAAEQHQTSSVTESKPGSSTVSECPIQADRCPALPQPGIASVMEVYSRREAMAQRTADGRAKLAKAGFALAMRTAEGDENLTPFRSLEDLLGAVKPILRSAARSRDQIWFSIRPIDLSNLDSDAA